VSRSSIRRWFTLAAVALGIVTAIGGTLGVYAIVRLSDARHVVVDRNGPAVLAGLRLANGVVNQERGVSGFELTGDERSLAPYREGRAAAAAALAELDERTREGGLRGVRDELRQVRDRVGEWQRAYAVPTIAAVRDDDADAPSAAAGRRMLERVRAATAALDAELGEVRLAGREDLASAASFLSGAFVAILLLMVAGIAVVGLRLRRVVDREELALLQDAHDQLDAQARELARSNTELEQFAYVASHDLQEPLRKVASFCQLIEQRYGDKLDERGRQYVTFAVDGAKRMQQLINDLLAFSRVGRGPLQPAQVDMDFVLDQARISLASAIEESSAQIAAGPLPPVRGEPALLAAVFQNLIGNALKFRRDGGVPPHIEIGAERVDGEWVFACADDGIGIEPEYAERIFMIFQRLHPKDVYAGTGIGLALCRKIVEYHGGRIWLDTEADDGRTTFRFTLPVIEEDA
jgi:signal transduction histidine kinase